MKRAAKAFANVIATIALTYALPQLVNLPVMGNALDAFYGTEAWDWLINKFKVFSPEDQEDLMVNCLGFVCLLISIGIVFAANRLLARTNKARTRVPATVSR